ncbi:HAD-IC family P-type ATPase [Halochromatium salexigens]|uniref:Cation-transporting P-type ATPase N-terminal domain-containing protein n=1 Tax=Halochromatium salexigens TaxID=49447 RepID=A0AAJ0UHP9_HALSE|nr:HAD-IC family P-type ATPase [Halochromatium salexigens]MBK5931521.1 hypothetical protein [Halochromatium salexigens]
MPETAQAQRHADHADDDRNAGDLESRQDEAWHQLEVEDALRALNSSRDGITDAFAHRRLETFGANQIGERREVSAWAVLLHQFTSPLIYVLLAALAATLAIGLITGEQRWVDAIVIGAVLMINSTAGPEHANGHLPEVYTGSDIEDWSDEELDEALGRVNVFARVEPIQKTRLVERLKANNEIVAVTGDGVNDAPALKAAHIGAAMGAGTDVAKEASDMVVTDNNFASVYHAVEEGRTAFRNVRMATFFLLSTGAAIVIMILTALGLNWPLPLLPAQILWLNVVTNGIADVALAFEPGEKALFRRPPRPPSEGVLDRILIERLVLVGLWLAAGSLGVFLWQWGFDVHSFAPGSEDNLTDARTAALTTMVLFQMVHVFNCRSEDVSLFRKSLFSNKVLFLGVLASLAVHVTAMYLPWTQQLLGLSGLDLNTWLWAGAVAATAIIVNELHKGLRPKRPRGAPAAGRQAALA